MNKKNKDDHYPLILSLMTRIDHLEQKVYKNKKPKTSLYQQILILHHLGMLDKIYELETSNVKKAELLSTLLNTDPSNTKKALEELAKKQNQLKNGYNYQRLVDVFESAGLQKLTIAANKILKEIEG